MQSNLNTIFVCVRDENDRTIATYTLWHYPTYQPGDELVLVLPRPTGKDRTIFTRITKPVAHVAQVGSVSPTNQIAEVSLNVSVTIFQDSNDGEVEIESITPNQTDHV